MMSRSCLYYQSGAFRAKRESAASVHDAGGRMLKCISRLRSAGFTLVEVMISVAMLGLIAGVSLWALSSDNNAASVNRYMIAAKMVAQARIDEAQAVTYTTTGAVPPVLATGSTTTAVTIADGTPPMTGTMTTSVAVADATLGVRRVSATINYTFRGRPYSVTLATARAPD
jgi:prepilin-type N-terminal cleavage/methylation domain-containing protein